MKTFPLDLALSFSLFMQCMWILLRKRPSRLVFSDTEGSLLGLGQQSPPSIPFPQAQMDANPSCTVKSRGNSLPFHVCACSSFPAASSNAFSSEFAQGIRNTEWRTDGGETGRGKRGREGRKERAEREETRKEERTRCTFGGRARASGCSASASVQNGLGGLDCQTPPPSGLTDRQSEEQGVEDDGEPTVASPGATKLNETLTSLPLRVA